MQQALKSPPIEIKNDLKGMTAAINNTRLAAERLGTTYASLKNISEEMGKAGYEAAEANRIAAQAIKLRIEGQKARTTEVIRSDRNPPDRLILF